MNDVDRPLEEWLVPVSIGAPLDGLDFVGATASRWMSGLWEISAQPQRGGPMSAQANGLGG